LKRPKEIRAAPREWISLFQVAYSFLREAGVGDLTLYGSQAMSVYMKNPLRSKDLDLLSSQVSLRQAEALGEKLSEIKDVEYWSTSAQTRKFDDRKMTTYAIELRVDGKPFFVESFDKILDGQPLSLLQPYLELENRWDLEFWTPSREATVALRLAFRQPEGITRLNATRLNSFIRENKRSLDLEAVASILKDWRIVKWVERNLIELHRRHRIRILYDQRMVSGIEGNILNHQKK
jgi:hypothetical protein